MYEGDLQKLIDELGRLPGIGPKSAQRIAFHVLAAPVEDVEALSTALVAAKRNVRFCGQCANISQDETCRICANPKRARETICVVEQASDVAVIERTNEYRGLYHVLGGAIDPMRGIGPNQLNIASLMRRLGAEEIAEVIIATDPNVEGEATAAYLIRAIKPLGVRVTRLASGLPVGGDLEYADEITLGRALEGRVNA